MEYNRTTPKSAPCFLHVVLELGFVALELGFVALELGFREDLVRWGRCKGFCNPTSMGYYFFPKNNFFQLIKLLCS
jgi:hypothetical protein